MAKKTKNTKKRSYTQKKLSKKGGYWKHRMLSKSSKINFNTTDLLNTLQCAYDSLNNGINRDVLNNSNWISALSTELYKKRNDKFLNESLAKSIQIKKEYQKIEDSYNSAKYGNLIIDNQLKLINCKKVSLDTKLGEGEFGEVFKGKIQLDRENIMCAIKTNKNPETFLEFQKEAKISSQFKHKNIVNLYGFCEKRRLIIYELCTNGELHSYLRSNINKNIDDYENIKMNWCHNIATGMEYLTSKGFVHRDLAARNVLLTENNIAKVADFGMTSQLLDNKTYYKITNAKMKLPVRWLSPEIFQNHKFDQNSDVWSFGITMIEIFSDGKVPYNNISNEEVIETLKSFYNNGNNFRIDCAKCPNIFYENIILNCFLVVGNRYTFKQLISHIDMLIGNNNEYGSIDSPEDNEQVIPNYQTIPESNQQSEPAISSSNSPEQNIVYQTSTGNQEENPLYNLTENNATNENNPIYVANNKKSPQREVTYNPINPFYSQVSDDAPVNVVLNNNNPNFVLLDKVGNEVYNSPKRLTRKNRRLPKTPQSLRRLPKTPQSLRRLQTKDPNYSFV